MTMLSARVEATRASLENLAQQQARSGLGLRPDMSAAARLMFQRLGEANGALGAGDATGAKQALDQAEANLEKLETFLGR
jgi:hypothetical protein